MKADGESWALSAGRRRNMQANRSRDTGPELAVRRLLHALGLRYRVNVRPVPGLRRTADIVFTKKRVAVFIDGCFWHGCPEHGRRGSYSSNGDYWTKKLKGNMERDAETTRLVEREGWTVLRFWEHDKPIDVAESIEAVVRPSGTAERRRDVSSPVG